MKHKLIQPSWYANIILWLTRLAIFVLLIAGAYVFYKTALERIFSGQNIVLGFVVVWLVTAYVVLPRVHRRLTKIYLPNYFIGRTRTPDGMLGDPVNLAVIGSKKNLKSAMKSAGWAEADPITLRSSLKIIQASIFKKSYHTAPVSSLYLFSRKQDFAFQKEENGDPRQRHHVRFWATPKGWWLPGGYQADWLGAGTFDTNVGLSLFTGQITHRIAAHVDEERDYIVNDLKKARATKKVQYVEHFVSGFHDRNGGGDRIVTDGSLPFIHL